MRKEEDPSLVIADLPSLDDIFSVKAGSYERIMRALAQNIFFHMSDAHLFHP